MMQNNNYDHHQHQAPTLYDLQESAKIKQILQEDFCQFESEAESKKKLYILGKLQSIIQEWIQQCGRNDGLDDETIFKSGGKLFTFGSFRLGVNGPNSDIDALLVAPRHIKRKEHFFELLAPLLRQNSDVSELTEAREAYVPIIKMKFQGVDIDMLFARIQQKEVGRDLENLLDNNILRNCDEDTIRSLNGCRVTDMILQLVPSKENFELTLRCIKLWAKNRGVYGNVFGYFGGVSWAMLVAKVCMLHSRMAPNRLLETFFVYFRDYPWGSQNPVTLCDIANDPKLVPFDIPESLLYEPSLKEKMPIITPAFPSMNSTFNVSESTKNIILTELEKGALITKAILKENSTVSWKRLFKKFNFFSAYQHFLMVQIISRKDEHHKKWLGFAEAKIKNMVKRLEMLDSLINNRVNQVLEIRPYPRSYDNIKSEAIQDFESQDIYFIGIRVRKGVEIKKENIDLTQTRSIFFENLQKTLESNRTVEQLIANGDCDIKLDYRTRAQLPIELRPKLKQRDELYEEFEESGLRQKVQ